MLNFQYSKSHKKSPWQRNVIFFQKLDTKLAFSAHTDFEKFVLISSFLVGNEKGINIKVKQD